MSTIRRLYDHPKNTEAQGNRFVQVCCDGNAPYWDTYRIYDDKDAWPSRDSERNMTAYKRSDPLQVQDDTGASDNNVNVPEFDINGRQTGSNDLYKGMVLVEGPNSGYKPDFLTTTQWMDWQGVEFSADPRGVRMANGLYTTSLPNPPRWRRTRIRTDKMKRGKGIGGWGAYDWTFLWCQKCETALESAWSDTLDALPIIARGVAMIVSNIPVFGTAISFVIHAAVSLAQDKPLDDAMLDAIGGALPGQPTSGMAFNAGVAIAKGERVDQVVVSALPYLPPEMRGLVKVAANVVYGIASGQNITKVAYDEIRAQLPSEAQQAMDAAKRIAQGENVPNMALTAAEQYVVEKVQSEAKRLIEDARNQGEAALASAKAKAEALFNQYAAETGYQVALMRLPTWERDAISTGLAAGAMARSSTNYSFGTVPEKNVAVNETYLQKGERLIAQGARFKGRLVSEMLVNGSFTVPIRGATDGVSLKWNPDAIVITNVTKAMLTPEFKRGFLIAFGFCEGMSQHGPGQQAVYQNVAEKGGRAGFDAGQAVQHYRTIHGDERVVQVTALKADNGAVSAALALFPKTVPLPPSTATVRSGIPTNLTLPSSRPIDVTPIAAPRSEPLVMDAQVYAQKTADRDRWVDYYKSLV